MTPEARAQLLIAKAHADEAVSDGVLAVWIAQAIREHARRFESVQEAFALLTDAQRLELVHSCCTECGAKDDGCDCWNDE